MAAFERLAHDVDVADAFEAVIGAAAGQLDEVGDQVSLHVLRVDEMRQPELAPERFARRIEIDADNHVGARHPRALDHVETDAPQPEYHDIRTRLDFGGIDDCADARRDSAADIANFV